MYIYPLQSCRRSFLQSSQNKSGEKNKEDKKARLLLSTPLFSFFLNIRRKDIEGNACQEQKSVRAHQGTRVMTAAALIQPTNPRSLFHSLRLNFLAEVETKMKRKSNIPVTFCPKLGSRKVGLLVVGHQWRHRPHRRKKNSQLKSCFSLLLSHLSVCLSTY